MLGSGGKGYATPNGQIKGCSLRHGIDPLGREVYIVVRNCDPALDLDWAGKCEKIDLIRNSMIGWPRMVDRAESLVFYHELTALQHID